MDLGDRGSKRLARVNRLYNKDLAPVPPEKRTWGIYNYASLWVAMSVCIPTYMLASGLIAGGMSWKQAIGTILLGNVIVLIPMILNAHAGAKYGIPFPVLVRASFGVRGANVPAVLRALVACGWFGIQSWIGGQAIYTMLQVLWPRAASSIWAPWICFYLFWLLTMAVIWRGIDTIKFLEGIGAPFMLAVGLLLLWWIARKAGGLGPVLHTPSKFQTTARVHALLHSVADRHGRILGHGGAEHSRFHPLRAIAESADDRPGAGTSARHDHLFVHRRGGDVGVGDPLRPSHLGSRGAAGALSRAGDRVHRSGRIAGGHFEHQCRGQRRLAIQRFFEPESAPDFFPQGRPHHRRGGRADDALEAARRIFRATFSDGWSDTRHCWAPSPES